MEEIVYKVKEIDGKKIAVRTINWQAKIVKTIAIAGKAFEVLGNPDIQRTIGITIVLTQLYLDSKDPTY